MALCLSCSALSTCSKKESNQHISWPCQVLSMQGLSFGTSTYHKLRSLCILLRNLLRLHSGRVISAECELSNGHIIQNDVEVLSALGQDPPDVTADHLETMSFVRSASTRSMTHRDYCAQIKSIASHLAHCQQLTGIVLGNDALERLLDDRRQHTLCVICTQRSVDLWKLSRDRPCQHPQPDVHLLNSSLQVNGRADSMN